VDEEYTRALADLSRDLIAAFPHVHVFAWKQGARGGRYWLPQGKQDVPANRVYGKKAESASKAGQGKPAAKKGEPKPAEVKRVAQAKYEAARDAHALAADPRSGIPPEKVAWLKARADKARGDLAALDKKPAASPAPTPAPGGKPEILTPKDKEVVEKRRKGLLGRIVDGIKAGYAKLEDRYGGAGAAATAAGIALTAPVPIPGAALVPVGIAEAVLQGKRLLGLTDEEKPKARKKPATPVHKTAARVSLDDPKALATALHSTAASLPAWNGAAPDPSAPYPHKVYVSHLYAALKDKLGGASLDEFKTALARHNTAGSLKLTPIDMPQYAADTGAHAASEMPGDLRAIEVSPVGTLKPAPKTAATVASLKQSLERSKAEPEAVARDADKLVARLESEHTPAEILQIANEVSGGRATVPSPANVKAALRKIRSDLTAVNRALESQKV
jgi:hypothetical protein